MKYEFEVSKKDYSDFSSGRVLYNAPNTTAFPVRLASEIISRSFSYLDRQSGKDAYKIYDPCCGGAHLLTVLGFLHGSRISEIIGTDIDQAVVEVAKRNLGLLTPEGLTQRKEQLEGYVQRFGKDSHKDALSSLQRLARLQKNVSFSIRCMQRDITRPEDFPIKDVNIIVTDLPYGKVVGWQGESEDPLQRLFENAYKALAVEHSIMVVVANKKQKLKHEQFKRIRHFKVGKRQVAFFQPLSR